MELDPRIKSLSDILTCFDIERAKEFVGQKGYFADSLYCFDDLGSCCYGTLVDACDGQAGPFHRRDNSYEQFFLPESSLKKKYRPYTLDEFCDKFPAGRPIKLRMRGGDEIGNFLLIGYWQKQGKEDAYIYIGRGSYDLEELFENYEWYDDATGDWAPFGVEVEE